MNAYPFQPIPGLWRFHILYLGVTMMLSWGFYPYDTSVSLLLVAANCIVGVVCCWQQWHMSSHVLALAIGLGTPVIVFTGVVWWQAGIFFFLLLMPIYIFRHHLF